jgi:hypothetical protein
MPKNGVMGLTIALNVIGFGTTEVSAACVGPGCGGYAYYAPPVYAYYPPPGAYYGAIVGYGYYLNPRYVFRQRLLLRSPL